MQSLLSELKRRNVFRVALGYAAAAWAVLEFADLVFPLLGLPDWSLRLVLVAGAMGFPIALVMAWVFKLTPAGEVEIDDAPREAQQAGISPLQAIQIGMIILLVMLVGYLYYQHLSEPDAPAAPAVADTGGSIAVLPFVNMSADPDNEYFSDGISEELLNVLASVKGLRVASRTSSFAFKNSNQDIGDIAQQLAVGTVLEGSVRKSGDTVRITAQLINASDGYHLWSKTYDDTLDNIFTVQDKIARAVVTAILPMLMTDSSFEGPAPTRDPEAYNHYLKGLALLREPITDAVLTQAYEEFASAIRIDPDYADAYAGQCETLLTRYTHFRDADAFTAAEQACNRGLTRAGDAGGNFQVHLAMGALMREAAEYDSALRELQMAHSARPGAVRPKQELALTYEYMGQIDQAIETLQEAILLDPSNWESHHLLANLYLDQQQYEQALVEFDKVLAIIPDYAASLIGSGSAAYMLGRDAEAEQKWLAARASAKESDSGSLGIAFTNLGIGYYYAGDFAKAVAMQREAAALLPAHHKIWGRLAESYRHLGDAEGERDSYLRAVPLAEETLTRNPRDWESLGLLGIYHAHLQQPDAARDYLQRMLEQTTERPTALYFAALIEWALQDADSSYRWLEEAVAAEFSVKMIRQDPDLVSLRGRDPQRFDDIMAQAPN